MLGFFFLFVSLLVTFSTYPQRELGSLDRLVPAYSEWAGGRAALIGGVRGGILHHSGINWTPGAALAYLFSCVSAFVLVPALVAGGGGMEGCGGGG